ncbi:MAG: hypothetical protein QNJ46_15565 [Leptolyngbyaceae cyanobacterium MO_188.B28]|nr:hypothetical protein [Leptolyngbyaceae cyanobacterium MO_188.B28]
MYFNPPYILFLAGFLAAITSGAAFSATLQQSVQTWADNDDSEKLTSLKGLQLKVPFLGICSGTSIFLAAGIQIFGLPSTLAYPGGIGLTLFSGLLIWTQLAKNLTILEQGGSKALDLDSL